MHQGYQQHTPSSTLHNMGDPSRGPPRLGINTGTILTKLNAAEEALGSRLALSLAYHAHQLSTIIC